MLLCSAFAWGSRLWPGPLARTVPDWHAVPALAHSERCSAVLNPISCCEGREAGQRDARREGQNDMSSRRWGDVRALTAIDVAIRKDQC